MILDNSQNSPKSGEPQDFIYIFNVTFKLKPSSKGASFCPESGELGEFFKLMPKSAKGKGMNRKRFGSLAGEIPEFGMR